MSPVTDWFSAVGSVVAAAGSATTATLAGFALRYSKRAANSALSQAQDSARQLYYQGEKDDQEQASKFAAWLSIENDHAGVIHAKLRYVNSSSLPVYSVTVAPFTSVVRMKFEVRIIEPTEGIEVICLDGFSDWLRRQIEDIEQENSQHDQNISELDSKRKEISEIAKMFRITPEQFKRDTERLGILLQFRDQQGVMWLREPNGYLRKSNLEFAAEWEGIRKNRMEKARESGPEMAGNLLVGLKRSLRWQTFQVTPEAQDMVAGPD